MFITGFEKHQVNFVEYNVCNKTSLLCFSLFGHTFLIKFISRNFETIKKIGAKNANK